MAEFAPCALPTEIIKSGYLAQDTGARKRKYMPSNLKIGDVFDGTHGPVRVVEDFLPPPSVLATYKDDETEKITIVLDKETVDFFRAKAHEFNASYQRMIRELLKSYAVSQSEKTAA